MKVSLAAPVAALFVAALLAASYSLAARTSGEAAATASALQQAPAAPAGQIVEYGHIRSLTRKGRRYELRFDPAFWLGGVTANRAAREDGVIGPGETVPNDYYIRDESRKLLTYLIPSTARATVITNHPTGFRATRVPISELALIVKGRNPRGRPLFDQGNHLGYWARVQTDTVRLLEQQYQP